MEKVKQKFTVKNKTGLLFVRNSNIAVDGMEPLSKRLIGPNYREGLLLEFSRFARYAQEAYCLDDIFGLLEFGVYADTVISEASREIIIFFKGFMMTGSDWWEKIGSGVRYPFVVDTWVDEIYYTRFARAWKPLVNKIKGLKLSKSLSEYRLVTTGHGEGGGMNIFSLFHPYIHPRLLQIMKALSINFHLVYAILAALQLKKMFQLNGITVYTFGAPRMGDKNFAHHVNKELVVFRITNSDDFITQRPFKNPNGLGYWHHETEYWISEETHCGCLNPFVPITPFNTKVYECREVMNWFTGQFEEPYECNEIAQSEIALLGFSSHYGPYFGIIMGVCPQDNPFELNEMIDD
ncbi:hypothetical protein G9A89_001431 [Geosiphon pyriformis]|nr:hypothetical protein G9A89_001431 [Geosiphon pyriformis]